MDYSPPGSSVHGISQARILEWVVIPFSRGSSWLRDRTRVSCVGRQILYHWATREAHQPLGESFCLPHRASALTQSACGHLAWPWALRLQVTRTWEPSKAFPPGPARSLGLEKLLLARGSPPNPPWALVCAQLLRGRHSHLLTRHRLHRSHVLPPSILLIWGMLQARFWETDSEMESWCVGCLLRNALGHRYTSG